MVLLRSAVCKKIIQFTAVICLCVQIVQCIRTYDTGTLEILRNEVKDMFQDAYDGYMEYAYPYDELQPLSCRGTDTWGSYSLTLIDALDTLAVMGNYSEFKKVADILVDKANFDSDINVSVFETNIRVVGGLLSAHLLSYKAGALVEPGWPCNGPLLRIAVDVARRLLPAFDTVTGMPYGTVNLRHGVPEGETTITCTAGIGSFIVEFGTLSRLSGDPIFEEVALRASNALYARRSSVGLFGNHVDVQTGHWTAQDAGIGAGVDSYFEYLVKGSLLLQNPELMHMFLENRRAITKYIAKDDWHFWVTMQKGQVTLPVFQSLEAFWPGLLSLTGDISSAMKSLHSYHQVWKQYGFTPEFYNIVQGEAGSGREGYPLRPELVESIMYLYRATHDPILLEMGEDILRSIQHSTRTDCGYATVKDVRDHQLEDRMESFFLAETTKYLYLLFDPSNFLHNTGEEGEVRTMPWGDCIVFAGGYVFNTEAHPIDPAALHCCYGNREEFAMQNLAELVQNSSKLFNEVGSHRFGKEETSREEESQNLVFQNNISDNIISEPETRYNVTVTENTDRAYERSWKENDAFPNFSNRITAAKSSDRGILDQIGTSSMLSSAMPWAKNVPNLLRGSQWHSFLLENLLAKIQSDPYQYVNKTWKEDFEILRCPARPFLERIAAFGEILDE